jgi:hypothetical protein
MLDMKSKNAGLQSEGGSNVRDTRSFLDTPIWETPKIEDVSEQVMAQPYIRFT